MTDSTVAGSLALDLTIKDPALEKALVEARNRAVNEKWADRAIGRRDPSAWTDSEIVKREIADRLGWLEAPFHFDGETPELLAFGKAAKDEGFTTAVLGGMGGSSLAPALLAQVFGPTKDGIPVRVLDSTDPEAVAATLDDLDPTATLFIVSTKSGTTAESLSFQAYQWANLEETLKEAGVGRPTQPGDFIAAITDPGKSLASIPHHDQLREVFLNPPDVGGRYSALTYVGLVPGALMGLNLDVILERARAMVNDCTLTDPARNPGLALGLVMGAFAKTGRDKLTFVIDRELAAFGPWVEQLIAESTGKHGVGIVPVDAEPLGTPDAYGNDRVFVRITLKGSKGPADSVGPNPDARLAALAEAGHPVVRIPVEEKLDIGAEFVRWEVATALSGIILGIDPFDQPNVEEAKANTRAVLARFENAEATEKIEQAEKATGEKSGRQTTGNDALPISDETALAAALKSQLARLAPNGYISIQAYFHQTPARDATLDALRKTLRGGTHRATTVGYGPRFLHSTGQLHKGGAPIGWFLQLVGEHSDDLEIPGKPYTFGQLIDAQAIGDARTIEDHKLPILRVNLGPDPEAGLAALQRAVAAALKR